MKITKSGVDPLEILLIPFNKYLWFTVLFTVLVSTIFSLVLRDSELREFLFGKRHGSTAYNIFVTVLGGATTAELNRNFARYSYMMWVILFLVLRNSYQSCLYHALKMNLVTPPPNSYEDIYNRGYIIWMNTFVYDYTKHLSLKFIGRIKLDDSYYSTLFEKMMSTEGKIAILSPSIYSGYFRLTHKHQSDNLFLMNEIFQIQQLTIFMRKNFFMKEAIDSTVLDYINNGFMERWESLNVDPGNYKRSPPATKIMTLNEAMGAHLILLNGLLLSVLIFLMELLTFRFKSYRQQKKRNQKHRFNMRYF